jgi:ElaB/YqjD/DUF883 family membrane-anchored ribosome-binding protein
MSDYRNDDSAYTDLSDDADMAAVADELATGAAAPPGAKRPLERAINRVESVVSNTLGGKAGQRVRERAEATLGRADAAIEGARYRVDRELADQPYRTLALAAGVGVVLGLLLARRERTIIYRPTH